MADRDEMGIDQRWLKALATSTLEKPKLWTSTDIKEMSGAKKAKSKIQGIFQHFYYDLIDRIRKVRIEGDEVVGPDEDMFDDWYEENEIGDYQNKYALMTFFNVIAEALQIGPMDSYDKDDFEKILSKIALRAMEEPAYIQKVREVITGKYPGLIGDFRYEPSLDTMNEQERLEFDAEIQRIEQRIESNVDEFEDLIQQIDVAKKTDFEQTAQRLNQIIIWGEAAWELVLYAVMSPYAPRITINTLDYRANTHLLMAGDISTAKSKVLKVVKRIAPKFIIMDDATKATFEGVAPTRAGEDIEDGILDWAKDGIIITEELSPKLTRMKLWRIAMDCEEYGIHKKGSSKVGTVNSTMLAACNPDEDFFQTEIAFRKQLPYKEGVLSRFDVLIPITATPELNDMLLDQIDLFGNKTDIPIDFNLIKSQMSTLATGMREIRRVEITEEQKEKLRDVFRQHNLTDQRRRTLKNRPLLILRDLETLARFVNTIAAVNFSRRRVDDRGVLHADDEDIDKAIQLWENLLKYRIQIYGPEANRNLRSVADEICLYMFRSDGHKDEIPVRELLNEIVNARRMIGKTTFYKELNTLIETGRLAKFGERDATVKLVIR